MKTVFLITVMSLKSRRTTQRTWGWFTTLAAAKKAVLSNATDMFECNYYDFAVIEEMPREIMPMAKQELWFYADYTDCEDGKFPKPKVSSVKKPESLVGIINFGIG